MKNLLNISTKSKSLVMLALGLVFMTAASAVFAEAAQDLGGMAKSITASFADVAKLITAGCYIAGLAFSVTAILQFKQHKDNPTQTTVGKPIALVFVAAALLFLPSILNVAGYTMFGEKGKVSTSKGEEFTPK